MKALGYVAQLLVIAGLGVHLATGHPIIAALWLLPFVAVTAAFILPNHPFTHFTFTAPIAGPIQKETERASRYHVRVAAWWALGSVSLPLALLALDFSAKHEHALGDFEAVLAVPLPVFGVASFLMCIGSLFRAYRALRVER